MTKENKLLIPEVIYVDKVDDIKWVHHNLKHKGYPKDQPMIIVNMEERKCILSLDLDYVNQIAGRGEWLYRADYHYGGLNWYYMLLHSFAMRQALTRGMRIGLKKEDKAKILLICCDADVRSQPLIRIITEEIETIE